MYALDKVKLQERVKAEKLGHRLEVFKVLRLIQITNVYSGATVTSRCIFCNAPIRINIDRYDYRNYTEVEDNVKGMHNRSIAEKCIKVDC